MVSLPQPPWDRREARHLGCSYLTSFLLPTSSLTLRLCADLCVVWAWWSARFDVQISTKRWNMDPNQNRIQQTNRNKNRYQRGLQIKPLKKYLHSESQQGRDGLKLWIKLESSADSLLRWPFPQSHHRLALQPHQKDWASGFCWGLIGKWQE